MVLRDIFLVDYKKKVLRLRNYFKQGKVMELRDLSDACMKEAVLKNDPVWAEIGVISYSLHKILSKRHIVEDPKFPALRKNILNSLNKSVNALEKFDFHGFEASMKSLVKNIFIVDQKLGNFVTNINDKSRIKMASTCYALGCSLGRAAQLTGANRKDVQKYIGYTTIHDELKETIGIKKRLGVLKKALEAG